MTLTSLTLVTLGLMLPLQGTRPLRKAELVRLLAAGALSKPAIATLVRRNCVTFRPTARDRAELRTAGADDAVLAAIDQCLRARAAAAPAAPRAPSPEPRAPLHVESNSRVDATAGGTADVTVQVFRGTVPQPGIVLILRGASAVPGGVTQDPTAITDQHGVATFRILAGTTAGLYRLTVAVPNGLALGPASEIAFFVTSPIQPQPPAQPAPALAPAPPPPARRVASEAQTQFTGGAGSHGTVGAPLADALVLEVRDSAGAPLAGQRVAFSAAGGTLRAAAAESDASGLATVRVTLGERAGPVVVTARVGGFTRTATVYADPGPARDLVVLRGAAPVSGGGGGEGLELRSRETVVLRVVARDAYANATRLENFAVKTTGPVIALWSTEAVDSGAVVTLEPRHSGMGTLEVAGSGLRARVPLNIVIPGPIGERLWAIGTRAAWLGANAPWLGPTLTGVSGADVAVSGRRTLVAGLSLALGGAAGSLTANPPTGGSLSVDVFEGFGSAEWSVVPHAPVSPVLALGVGAYRLKSGDGGQTVYHTNAFWSGGGGVDIVLSPTVTAELRAERQWMRDANQGHVATLWPLAAGVRVGF
jgi:Bacterial Ig-like domain (group 1)